LTEPVKILGVDDEADFEALIRQRFRRQVRDSEFTFRFAHHGEEALAALVAEPDIQLMLLDINMPVMDGLTLLNELRERKSPVRTIMVSAYGDMTNLRTAMNRGAFDFVTKPVDFSDLEVTIQKTLADIAKLHASTRRLNGHGATCPATSRRTSWKCWRHRTNRSGRSGGRRLPFCLSISSASRGWRRVCRPRRW
jgi:DNA-binding NtrC family response regulator